MSTRGVLSLTSQMILSVGRDPLVTLCTKFFELCLEFRQFQSDCSNHVNFINTMLFYIVKVSGCVQCSHSRVFKTAVESHQFVFPPRQFGLQRCTMV